MTASQRAGSFLDSYESPSKPRPASRALSSGRAQETLSPRLYDPAIGLVDGLCDTAPAAGGVQCCSQKWLGGDLHDRRGRLEGVQAELTPHGERQRFLACPAAVARRL